MAGGDPCPLTIAGGSCNTRAPSTTLSAQTISCKSHAPNPTRRSRSWPIGYKNRISDHACSKDRTMNTSKRRAFLKSAGLGGLSLAIGQRTARAAKPSEKLIVGVIGTGGMGSNHLKTLAQRKDAKVAFVCDVDKNRLAAAVASVASVADNSPTPVDDLRRVLDDQNVDAV